MRVRIYLEHICILHLSSLDLISSASRSLLLSSSRLQEDHDQGDVENDYDQGDVEDDYDQGGEDGEGVEDNVDDDVDDNWDKGSHHERKVQFFLTLFKKPLTPPPPIRLNITWQMFLKEF